MAPSAVLILSLFLSVLLVIDVHSYNLLCDFNINWIQYPASNSYKFNYTTCRLSVSASINVNEKRTFSVSSIFSNSSNYPLNFTIHGQSYNGDVYAGIVFRILNNGFWGIKELFSNNVPLELTYEWETMDDITHNIYKDQTLDGIRSSSTNPASNIIEIGILVDTAQLNSTNDNGIIFDNVYLNALKIQPTQAVTSAPTTNTPTTNIPTTYNPTTNVPTTYNPTTNEPTTYSPTTHNPTTHNPTNTPTHRPTVKLDTTALDCNGYIVIVSFDYTISSNDIIDDIGITLVNMMQEAIITKNNSLLDCYISTYSVNIESDINSKVVVNISMCTECEKHVIENDLFGELRDNNNIITVEPGTKVISVDIIRKHNEAEHGQSTTQQIVSNTDQTTENSKNNIFWVVITVLLCIICISIIFIAICVIRKLKTDTQQEKNVPYRNKTQLKTTNVKMLRMNTIESNTQLSINTKPNSSFVGEAELNNEHANDGDIHNNITPGNDNDDTGDNNSNNSTPSGGGNDDFDTNLHIHTKQYDYERKMNEIENWLISIGLETYYQNFIENGYDSFDIISCVTNVSELSDIGIHSKQHLNKILKEIRKLNKSKKNETKGMKVTDEGNNDGDVIVVYDT